MKRGGAGNEVSERHMRGETAAMEITMTVIPFTERNAEGTSFSATRSFAGRCLQWLLNTAVRCVDHVRRQRAMAELQALDDRHLRDIGISRSEIWYRVNHPQER